MREAWPGLGLLWAGLAFWGDDQAESLPLSSGAPRI